MAVIRVLPAGRQGIKAVQDLNVLENKFPAISNLNDAAILALDAAAIAAGDYKAGQEFLATDTGKYYIVSQGLAGVQEVGAGSGDVTTTQMNTAIAAAIADKVEDAQLATTDAAVAANTAARTQNTTDIATNTGAITTINTAQGVQDAAIAANTAARTTNTTDIAALQGANTTSDAAIAANTAAHTANAGTIGTNTTDIATNASDIAAETAARTAADTALQGQITTNANDITALEAAQAAGLNFNPTLDDAVGDDGEFLKIADGSIYGPRAGGAYPPVAVYTVPDTTLGYGRGDTASRPAIGSINLATYVGYYDTDLGFLLSPDALSSTDWVDQSGGEA